MKLLRLPSRFFPIVLPLLQCFCALQARASGVVNNCTETDLRAAMAGGGFVTFACDGVISLTNELVVASDTVIDGAGHAVTISGGNATRVFRVSAGNSMHVDQPNHIQWQNQ